MKKIYLFFAAFIWFAASATAQESLYARQLIVVNGGSFSNPDDVVTVAAYNPSEMSYLVFDEIGTQSAQHVIVDGHFAYIAAQDSLVKYDIDSYERVAAIELDALKNLAVYEDMLIVTRQYPATEDFIYLLNAADLSLIAALNPSGEASGVVVAGDTAYVAVPGAWGTTEGKLAIVDLLNGVITKELNFGSAGKGLKDVLHKNGIVYTVNSHFSDYTNNVFSISQYAIETGDTSTTMFFGDYYGYYGHSVMSDSAIYLPLSVNISKINLFSNNLEAFIAMNPSSMVIDTTADLVYVAESDYLNWGKLHAFSPLGEELGAEIVIGIAPEGLAIDYRESSAKIEDSFRDKKISIYPNPAKNKLSLETTVGTEIQTVKIFDYSGRLVEELKGAVSSISLINLTKGTYILHLITADEILVKKIVKI